MRCHVALESRARCAPPTVPPGLALQPPRHTCGAQGGGWGCPRGEGGTPRLAGGSPRGAGKDLGHVGQRGRGVVDMRVQGAGCTVQWVHEEWGQDTAGTSRAHRPKAGRWVGLDPRQEPGLWGATGPGVSLGQASHFLCQEGAPWRAGGRCRGSSPSHRVGPRPASSRRAGPRRWWAPAD